MSSLSDLLKKASEKASDVLQTLRLSDAIKFPGKEGDIIYSKNNVCLHPNVVDGEPTHVPGYLTLHCQKDEVLGITLILQWLPNATLEKNPRSIRTMSPRFDQNSSPRSRVKLRALEGDQGKRHRRSSSGSSSSPPVLETSESATAEEASDEERNCRGLSTVRVALNDDSREDEYSNNNISLSTTTTIKNTKSAAPRPPQLSLTPDNNSLAPSINVIPNTPTPTAPKTLTETFAATDVNKAPRKSSATTNSESPPTSGADDDDFSDEDGAAGGKKRRITTMKQKCVGANSKGVESSSSSYSSGQEDADTPTNKDWENGSNKSQNVRQLPAFLMSFKSEYVEYMEKATPEEFARWHDMVLPDGVVTSTGSYPPPPPAESPDEESAQQNWILNREEPQGKQSKKRQLENGQLKNNTSSNGGGACLFSVDLGQMRSFRLFYSNQECTCGQLVIASLNARYKILHFHNGGLDKLCQIFEQWNAVRAKSKKGNDSPLISTSLQCHQFAVLKPQITKSEQHPEEGLYEKVAWDFWRSCTNSDGQIDDDLSLRKAIFFGGLDQTLRKEAWPFLLNVYPWNSTFEQRDQIRNDLFLEYQNIRKKRLKGALKMGAKAWTYVETTVAKDVVRTDRKNPFFTGENNPNLEKMRNILMNYAAFCPQIGYVQGMSDLLAAVLIVLNEESDAFWCFAGLIQRSIFVEAPKNDTNMKLNIEYLRCLIKLMSPTFYDHLATCQDGLDLLFVHRWILLCFKREFVADDAMRIWESCWSNYQTSYFHLFVCLAIVSVYGEDVVQQKLPYDEILLYFSSLAMHMNVDVVLRKARGLLYQFERRDKIPCTLANVCQWQRMGMWDGTGGQQPEIECAGNHEDMDACPYLTANDI